MVFLSTFLSPSGLYPHDKKNTINAVPKQGYNMVSVFPTITHEPLDRFASNFDLGTRGTQKFKSWLKNSKLNWLTLREKV